MIAPAIILALASALIFLPGLVAIVSKADARADARRRAEQGRQVDESWPRSLAAHPSAERIRERIAQNEGRRLDDEWLRVSKEWSL